MGRVRGRLQPARHGHPSLLVADWRSLLARLVCLGCTHTQPKNSAAPIFRRMLISHRRSLAEGERAGEPACCRAPARRPVDAGIFAQLADLGAAERIEQRVRLTGLGGALAAAASAVIDNDDELLE